MAFTSQSCSKGTVRRILKSTCKENKYTKALGTPGREAEPKTINQLALAQQLPGLQWAMRGLLVSLGVSATPYTERRAQTERVSLCYLFLHCSRVLYCVNTAKPGWRERRGEHT